MRRSIFCRCLLTAELIGLCAAPAWAIGTPPPIWKPRETVASTLANYQDSEGADRSLAYDHFGNPGIVFYDDFANDLSYARRVPGAGWVLSAVDTIGDVGSFPSLAYDRYERPAISYFNFSNGHLKYARLNGGTWQIESADTAGGAGWYTSLAFDLMGRPAIAYYDTTNTSLKYVQDTDGDFSLADEAPVTVVNQFSEGHYASLVFDSWNRPMIAHFDDTNDDLRFSVQEPGIGWVTTTVDSTTSTGFWPSLAIDPDTGFPAIAYFNGSTNDLRYAVWDGDAWNRTTVDATGSVGHYPSLAFDPADGNPAIAYANLGGGNLKLAWQDGSSWHTQTVDAVGTVGYSPSLAFNEYGTGFPSIAYFNSGFSGTGSLYFIDDPPDSAAAPEPTCHFLLCLGIAGTLIGPRRPLAEVAYRRR